MAYDESYFTARESWRDWRIEATRLLELARVTRDTRALDLGCGGGGLSRLAHERGAHSVGVDTLDVALHLAHRRAIQDSFMRLSFAQIGEDNRLPFRSHSFDALLAQHVVEHLADLDDALREWSRVLKPGGRLALATPNVRYPDPAHFADDDHAHIFAPDELRARLERAGWRVETCLTIFPYLSRVRALRAFGVIASALFARAPYYAARGRTILLSAVNCHED